MVTERPNAGAVRYQDRCGRCLICLRRGFFRPNAGRCARGDRLVSHVPQGHWKTITFVAALRRHGMPFSKLKAYLRKAAERTIPRLRRRIGRFAPTLTAREASIYFRHAGYA